MAVLREMDGPVPAAVLARTWDEAGQRTRCLAGLVEDGLAVRAGDAYALP
jgi:A/G-specific adenine glycosylase